MRPVKIVEGFLRPFCVPESRRGGIGRLRESLYPPQDKEDGRREVPFLSIRQALEEGELENVYWMPGTD